MKVLKFGGTSMGSAQSILEVKRIVQSQSKPVVVVVSAVGGVTDKLLATAEMASKGGDYQPMLDAIVGKHDEIVTQLFADRSVVDMRLSQIFSDLGSILKGVSLLKELSTRSLDTISGFGERLSSTILSLLIDGSKLVDSSKIIITQNVGGRNIVVSDLTTANIRACRKELSDINIFPGFISSNQKGEPTTLGRGGSDYTAALLAADMDAEILEIWTDVDGFMSADPRIISRAYTLEHLTYAEAMELSHFGAKVIYPPTILPVLGRNIPIRIKNTFNPTAPGTLIDGEVHANTKSKIKGISSIRNVSLLTLQCIGMVGVSGISMRMFKALAAEYINVILISQASSENSISVLVESKDAELASKVIDNEFEHEISVGHVAAVKIGGRNCGRADEAQHGRVGNAVQRRGNQWYKCLCDSSGRIRSEHFVRCEGRRSAQDAQCGS